MTHNQGFARTLGLLLISMTSLVIGIGAPHAEEHPQPSLPKHAGKIIRSEILEHQSRFSISTPDMAKGQPDTRAVLVALPRGTTEFQLQVDGPAGVRVSAPEGLMSMRGQPVLRAVLAGCADQEVELRVRHNGKWSNDPARALLPLTMPETNLMGTGAPGSYLVVYAPVFSDAIAPLLDWKTRKGYQVRTVSTNETGASTEGIKNYIQNAYDTWANPPQFILLVGDVNEIPTYNFYGNPSDQPYVQLDGDDWLMDAAVGRLPVENETEAHTLINKIINYERHPSLAGQDQWQTRSLMVAGVFASDTPGYTVDFCGRQLESIGFQQPSSVSSPPLPSLQGAQIVSNAINTGVGFVVYRGWAYGTAGWDPPQFTVDSIPGLDTNNMTPIVMSFVCLNGDYTSTPPCFGEVFVRQGTPDEPGKGAVAFIGNGEHWSHTRYNDAMAISVFERIADPAITDLGTLLNSGKFRFLEYFPTELSAAEFGEESVEFYFHIYNLMGDPSLQFWRQLPRDIQVSHPANLPAGTDQLSVSVAWTDGGAPVAGTRVGVVQNGVLIGSGVTTASGSATIPLLPVSADSDIAVTVSESGVIPYEGTITTGTATVFLTATSLQIDDSTGNDDQVVNPGEALALTPTIRNQGLSSSGLFSLTISQVQGSAASSGAPIQLASLAGGAEVEATESLGLTVDSDAADGSIITLSLDATRSGDQHDLSTARLLVHAPAWQAVSLADANGSAPRSGQTTDLALTLKNTGTVPTAGGTVSLTLLTADGASLGTTSATFGPCLPGGSVTTEPLFDLTVAPATATGTNLTFNMNVASLEGYQAASTCALVVGPVDVSSPVGPDNYGYFAYDSADFDYPAKRPHYHWQEISTSFGGPGTKLDFPVENEVVWMVVDLPFTFRYYGQDYSSIRVSDNGWVSFDTGTDYDFYNWPIPSQYGVEALVAPFWDNLNPVPPQPGEENVNGIDPDGIYTYHDTDTGEFLVEWSRLPHYKPEILGLQTFQVALLDPATHPTDSGNGEILFLYRQVNNNDYLRMYATVGIESPDGNDGLQLSYSNINAAGMAPLQPGLAVRISTDHPQRVPFTLSSFTSVAAGGHISLAWDPVPDRPVLGWYLDCLEGGLRTRLNTEPLPGDVHRFDTAFTPRAEDATFILTALHPFGVTSEAGSIQAETSTVSPLVLEGAHPNPTRGSTSIRFSLPREAEVRLRIYDVAGRLVRTLLDGSVASGPGVRIWDGYNEGGTPAADGVYFLRLETGPQTLTRKLILVR